MKTIRPLQDRLVVKRIEGESQTPGDLFIPDNAKEKPTEAEVLAVGPGKRGEDGVLWPMAVKVGDRVLFCGTMAAAIRPAREARCLER